MSERTTNQTSTVTPAVLREALVMLLSEFYEHVPNWKQFGCSTCWVEAAQEALEADLIAKHQSTPRRIANWCPSGHGLTWLSDCIGVCGKCDVTYWHYHGSFVGEYGAKHLMAALNEAIR